MEIVFATNNKHKLEEARVILPEIKIISLEELGFREEIPEPHNTLEANAFEKARRIHDQFNCNCFSDDTGLEIDFLDGEPGVHSARYAGDNASFQDNVEKVLDKMSGADSRAARFRTVVALILDVNEHTFEGSVEGSISRQPQGKEGFGYDPIFRPIGDQRTFAEMTLSEKNTYSHRARAMEKLANFLGQ
jgi:XTP/dITP diphosphohydrolase